MATFYNKTNLNSPGSGSSRQAALKPGNYRLKDVSGIGGSLKSVASATVRRASHLTFLSGSVPSTFHALPEGDVGNVHLVQGRIGGLATYAKVSLHDRYPKGMSFGTNEPSTPECYDEDVHFAKKLSFARNDVVAVSYRPDNALAVCMHTSFDETSVAHSATDNVFWYEKRDTSLGDLTATPHRLSGGEWVFVSIHGYTFVGEGNCIGTDNLPGPHIFEEDILSSDIERCKLRCDEESLCTGLDTFLGKCRIFTGEIVSSDVSSYFGQLCFRKVPGTAHMVKTKLLQTAPESMKVSIVAVEAGYVSENSNAYSDTANACPNGFLIEPNTITSGDVWASSHGITTLDGCGQACTAVSSCHAFEWGGGDEHVPS